ncbi:MAG: iron-sulfur cluster assembly protein IscA [Gammaproteobacteria bacterium RIFCSPLOWO2_02_FULL_61_13]|nr:MAG: iron-sulfur cluster assembly protein IscA [Gammaproteobacteria bacterium RIFCSPLOWO2_02_FULL_61_13]
MTEHRIELTERAATHVRKFLARHDGSVGLRVGVKPTGCSGYKYVVEPADQIGAADCRFESNGVQLVVSADDMKYLAGTEVDFVRDGLNEGFRFKNPNVQDACGCGESFNFATPVSDSH